MTLDLILFALGFFILIKGAQILINGASSIARVFGVSSWVIGVIIVGIGTSIPELSINIASVFNQSNIGLGTVIGSNTFNILVILGLSALLAPIKMKRVWVIKDFSFNILAILAAIIFIYFPVLGSQDFAGISRPEGIALLLMLLLWLGFEIRHRRDGSDDDEPNPKIFPIFASVVMILAGLIGVYIGGEWVVSGAGVIAEYYGVTNAFVSLTLVAIGTSVPELAVSLTALFGHRNGIAVGNIIGSNIFDFLGIFGAVAVLQPLDFPIHMSFDIFVTLLAAIILMSVMFIGRKKMHLKRWHGVVFLLTYLAYFIFLVWRG